MSALSEQEFRLKSVEALERARRALLPLADDAGFEIDLQDGVMHVEFEHPPAKFVVSPNAPVRQIWVSAMSRSYKLAWSSEADAFTIGGEALPRLLERLARTLLGQI